MRGFLQARCANLQSAGITLRIFREIRQRVPAWQPLSTWVSNFLMVERLFLGRNESSQSGYISGGKIDLYVEIGTCLFVGTTTENELVML